MINFVCEFDRVDGTISIGEDCAGLATFSLAVESAVRSKGGTVDKVWASDNDIALRTMLERLGEFREVHSDVTVRDARTLPKVKLYGLGSPCQGESIAGSLLRAKDTRAKALESMVAWLSSGAANIPESFVMENVGNQCRGSGTRAFGRLISRLKTNFVVKFMCLNSRLWVPQNRDRTYIVGILKTSPHAHDFEFPIGIDGTVPDLASIIDLSLPCFETKQTAVSFATKHSPKLR